MRTLLLAFLLVSRCALAQLDDVAFVGSLTVASSAPAVSINPTNLSGYPAISWWKGNGWTKTTSETWTDWGAGGHNLSQPSLTTAMTTGTLDAQTFVSFSAADFSFMSSTFTTAQPFTLVGLVRIQANTASGIIFGDNGSARLIQTTSSGVVDIDQGNYDIRSFNTWSTNVWVVIEAVFNGASSGIYTNGVLSDSGNAGTGSITTVKVGGAGDYDYRVKEDVLEIVLYGTNLSSGARSSLYNYFKTNYPSASLP